MRCEYVHLREDPRHLHKPLKESLGLECQLNDILPVSPFGMGTVLQGLVGHCNAGHRMLRDQLRNLNFETLIMCVWGVRVFPILLPFLALQDTETRTCVFVRLPLSSGRL